MKPELVIETGVHDGLGSSVLLRALDRNAAEGHEGRLVAFDIRPDVGWIVPSWLRGRYELQIGDVLAILDDTLAGRPPAMFIHDSDHGYEHETAEFEAVLPRAIPGAVLMSDNAHASTAMRDVCLRHGLPFTLAPERPAGHFYPGAGIGVSRAVQAPQP